MWFLNTCYLETIQFVKRRSLCCMGERLFCRVFKIHNIFFIKTMQKKFDL